jgi:hypothetical protein
MLDFQALRDGGRCIWTVLINTGDSSKINGETTSKTVSPFFILIQPFSAKNNNQHANPN